MQEKSPEVQLYIQQLQQSRAQCQALRDEKVVIQRNLIKKQGQVTVSNANLIATQKLLEQAQAETKRWREQVETMKKQQLNLVNHENNASNQLTHLHVQLSKLANQAQILKSQNQRLNQQSQKKEQQMVRLFKQRQEFSNMITLNQTHSEAINQERRYFETRKKDFEDQIAQLKKENQVLQQKVAEDPLQVKVQYKDHDSTKQNLLKQFEGKMSDKQRSYVKELQKYETNVQGLRTKVILYEDLMKNAGINYQ